MSDATPESAREEERAFTPRMQVCNGPQPITSTIYAKMFFELLVRAVNQFYMSEWQCLWRTVCVKLWNHANIGDTNDISKFEWPRQ